MKEIQYYFLYLLNLLLMSGETESIVNLAFMMASMMTNAKVISAVFLSMALVIAYAVIIVTSDDCMAGRLRNRGSILNTTFL